MKSVSRFAHSSKFIDLGRATTTSLGSATPRGTVSDAVVDTN